MKTKERTVFRGRIVGCRRCGSVVGGARCRRPDLWGLLTDLCRSAG